MSRFTFPLYLRAGIVTSCVAFLFGLDTGSIGPITAMSAFKDVFGHFSATVHGVIVSSVILPGAITALFAGALAHRFGHVAIIALGSAVYGAGAAIECGAPSLPIFIVGRLLKGAGQGLFLSNVYVQVTETSPARVRGILSALPQILIVTGIVTGFFICYGTQRIEDSSAAWRIPLAVASFLGFLLSGTFWVTPPSPRWLLSKGRIDEARDVVARLGIGEDEQRELMSESQVSLENVDPHISFWRTVKQTLKEFREAFAAPFRARTAFSCFLLALQQFSGIDGVLYYAPILFAQAGLASEQASFLASGVSALVMLAVTIPATLFADKWGRKTSSVVGGMVITALMLLMGSLYAANQVHAHIGAGKWVVIVSIYLFAIAYNVTWAIAFRTSVVESLPSKVRSSASSLAQSANWFANYTVALITPILIAKSVYAMYYLFAGCTLLGTVLVALFMVETQGHSLEAIERNYSEAQARSTSQLVGSGTRLRRLRVMAE
jgi:sugar porter (SP) family MFS transporter